MALKQTSLLFEGDRQTNKAAFNKGLYGTKKLNTYSIYNCTSASGLLPWILDRQGLFFQKILCGQYIIKMQLCAGRSNSRVAKSCFLVTPNIQQLQNKALKTPLALFSPVSHALRIFHSYEVVMILLDKYRVDGLYCKNNTLVVSTRKH